MLAEAAVRIEVKATGALADYLPASASGDLVELEVPEGATPLEVARLLGMPAEERYLVVVNGVAVPRREQATRRLEEGDRLALMPPLMGG